eukprot:4123955-Alexandrium_andersonii.AAC.1
MCIRDSAAPPARVCPRGASQKTPQAQPGTKHRKARSAGTCYLDDRASHNWPRLCASLATIKHARAEAATPKARIIFQAGTAGRALRGPGVG